MKPFLLLSTRPEDDAAEGERAAIVRLACLSDDDVEQVRVEMAPLPTVDVDRYRGVLLGGGPFNSSDEVKSELQQRVEADVNRIVDECIGREIPFLGLCYGVGVLTDRLGGTVDRTYGENVGVSLSTLTEAGRTDPLFDGVPGRFHAFTGHKEACLTLPPDAKLLASGEACPVQAFRIGRTVYATQFHPELDSPGLAARIRIYRDAGYFAPEDTEKLVEFAMTAQITPEVHLVLQNFVRLASQQ